ncbi:MAG: outer membrane protein assembly factor BamA [Sutterellaceae bacterium]|nr:outer membrane protein assembly factor BamA [Burkholderiaceae bacterium]MDW8429651.1 outer membrane protein assembly factor BamA [Sutterellaceae bacterium]
MRARNGVAAAVALAFSAQLAAQEFVVRDIRVEGIQRIEVGTVFSYLPIRVGDRFDPEKGVAAIRALFATGLFKDVRLEADGDTLIVLVEERPAIAQVELTGVREFDKETVKKSLRDVGLAEGRVFDRSLLERAEQELKRQYLARGLFAVQVQSTVTPVERNRVNVTIAVAEGEPAKIRSIRFTGNRAFSDATLRDQMQLGTPNWISWYTKRDQYSRQKLAADLESLRSFYLNRGYLDFNIESTQVSISPDKKAIHITINITEGERYTVTGVKLAGELLGLDEELTALIDVKPGDVYNAERLAAVSKRITDRLGVLGYAFATANPVPEANREKREVAFTILVDPGRRVYVRRVNITGNTNTRDDVIRREVRQFELAWFDAEKVRLSRDRIDRLGFFEKVEVETPAVPGSLDQVDVNFTVKERPTGSIQAGIGYSSSDKVVLQAAYSQQNVFGSGQSVSLEVNTSRANKTVALTHVDPYVTQDGISRTTELYQRRSDLARLGLGSVDFLQRGAALRFGVPFTEFDTVYFGLGYEGTDITLTASSPPAYVQYVSDFGERSHAAVSTLGWARDSRDNVLVPNRGRYQRLFVELALPMLDLRYYRSTYQFQQFVPLTSKYTVAANVELGWGGGYGGRPYPLFKNFYVGGIGSVRGFEGGSLGPRDALGNPTGGTRRLNMSLEALAPLPGADRTLRALAFLDGGQVWSAEQRLRLGDLRYSVGIGLAWVSPIGPLKLSYGYPLKRQPGDRPQRFQFQIGTGF